MVLAKDLGAIVGHDYVSQDADVLQAYSRDESFTRPMRPPLVVRPKNVDEVQKIVQWTNRTLTPLVPVSSGAPHFRGDTVPGVPGAVIVDLRRMDRIIRIDARNRVTIIEPGVTYGQLQPELAKDGLSVSMPLLPRASKSVMTSLLEREPRLLPKYQWHLLEPLRCMEVIWGSGDKLWTGEAGSFSGGLEEQWAMGLAQLTGYGPRHLDYHRLVQGAQGSMGIATWISIRCEELPRIHKLFFVPADHLENLLPFAYRLLRYRYGDELLLLNGANLAYILGDGAETVRALRKELPAWVLILGIAGRKLLPEKRVDFQEKDIRDMSQQFGLPLLSAIPGASDRKVLDTLNKPSPEPYWKLRHRGACQDVFFLTTLNRTPGFVNTFVSLSQATGYSPSKIGIYIQPAQQGVACHCEFNLPFDPHDQGEVERVKRLLGDGSERLMREGAFFSRPYGGWAPMVYNGDAQTTMVLKKVKGIFDPHQVMNPGKLCF